MELEEAQAPEFDQGIVPGSHERFQVHAGDGRMLCYGSGHRLETYDEIATRLLALPTKDERRAALDRLAPELRPFVADYMTWQWRRERVRLNAAAAKTSAEDPIDPEAGMETPE
jgi:hypothetical protein